MLTHPEQRDRTIWEMFEAERSSLVPYAERFDGFHALPASVSKTCLVRFDNNEYSVIASAVGRPVEIRAYADRIELRQDGRIVGEHRAFEHGRDTAPINPVSGAPQQRRLSVAATARSARNPANAAPNAGNLLARAKVFPCARTSISADPARLLPQHSVEREAATMP